MKNFETWKPTKYVYRRGCLRGARNSEYVSSRSELITDAIARKYDMYISQHCRGELVDLGYGSVPLYEAYRKYVDRIVCVDWPQSLHDKQFVDYECDLSREFPFADSEFDTAILSDVLEHLPEPLGALREVQRILRPEGKCVLNVPFYYWLHEEPFDYYRYTEHALRQYAEIAGFRVIVLEPIGGCPEIIGDVLAKNIESFPLLWRSSSLSRFAGKYVQRLVSWFVATNSGRRMSHDTSRMMLRCKFTSRIEAKSAVSADCWYRDVDIFCSAQRGAACCRGRNT